MTQRRPASIWLEGSPRLHALGWNLDAPLTVVLLHGSNQHAYYWSRLAPRLVGYRSLALSFRGHGRSEWVQAGGYGVEGYLDDVDRLVERCVEPGRRFVLVGHSMGSLVAMRWAHRSPSRLAAAAFIDIDPTPPARQRERLNAAGSRPPRMLASLEEARALIDRQTPGLPRTVVATLARESFARNRSGEYAPRMDSRTLVEFPQYDNQPLLSGIGVAALVVRGDASTVSSDEGARDAVAALPRGELSIVAGEHQLHIQNPAGLAAVLRPFLRRHTS